MRKVFIKTTLSILIIFAVLLSCCMSTLALDDKYKIDELGMSIKIPKQYMVITRTLERDDEVFAKLRLDYDETMTAFSAANIYLQAISDDGFLKITLTETSDENSKAINNYSELSDAQRKQVLDAFMDSGRFTSGVEIKHNANIYFDFAFAQQTNINSIFCYQCHTVVNGMNINLTLQKNSEELTQDEIKIVTDMANTIAFEKIKLSSGPSFEWWRFLLWIAILVVIALLSKYLYSLYNSYRSDKLRLKPKRKQIDGEADVSKDTLLESHEYKRESGNLHTLLSELGINNDEDEYRFDELLGYDTTDYKERAHTEFESFDIKVKTKNKSSSVSYFEDSGKSINRESTKHSIYSDDFFDEYFGNSNFEDSSDKSRRTRPESPTKKSSKSFKYFLKNLSNMLTKRT